MRIGTLTTGSGVVTTISLTYLPSALHFDAGTQLTGLKVTVLGDGVITDLDAAGLNAVGKANRVTSDVGITFIPLADGIVTGKNVTIEITNSAAQTPAIYAFSMKKKAGFYIRNIQQKAFASTPVEFAGFMAAYFPSFVAADEMNVTYRDGLVQKMAPEDLRVINSIDNQINDNGNDFYVNNVGMNVKGVSFIADSDQQVYLTKYSNIGNL